MRITIVEENEINYNAAINQNEEDFSWTEMEKCVP